MPIRCALRIRNLTQPEFDERDAVVMRCAYASQNALGRLCEERVYETDLGRRLYAEGFTSVHTQVPVTVIHEGYAKEYRLDLVADDGVYELKTTNAFAPEHDTQVLHYAMLLDVNHAKLLNFRPGRVQGRLKFNALLGEKRYKLHWDEVGWHPLSPQCEALKHLVVAMLEDWGAGLELRLYEEALMHFFGGEARCLRRVPLRLDDLELGSHTFAIHSEGLCFLLTAFTMDVESQKAHIARLLALTPLRAAQWINFNHTTIQLQTVQAR